MDVVCKGLLQMNQPALARAIGPVLEDGKGGIGSVSAMMRVLPFQQDVISGARHGSVIERD
jgi:hypothetical protein